VKRSQANTASRFVSITFDDGLINGTRKAIQLLEEFELKATFYVVTGWIRPRHVPWVRDRWNKGLDHGSWRDWIDVRSRGHDVGSHTVSHLNAGGRLSRYLPFLLRWELSHSCAQLRHHLGHAPTSISMPWNTPAKKLEHVVRRTYQACRLGSGRWQTNNLTILDWHRLRSWAPTSEVSGDELLERCRATPPGHWLILQFHSLDGEGYMPITTDTFGELLRGLKDTPDLQQRTVDEMIREAKPPTPSFEP
jgi:hypothetical protein